MAPRRSPISLWCEKTWPDLYRFIYSRVQNRQAAEDLTQEAYTRILTSHDDNKPPPSQRFLHTVALNLIRDRWRRLRNRGGETPLEEALLAAGEDGSRVTDRLWLEGLMEALPRDQKTVLTMRIVRGYSRAETARRMSRTEASVRGLQYRAVQNLRRLADEGRS